MLFALSIVAGILPVSFADNNQEKNKFKLNESNTHVKVDKAVEVNGAYKYKKYKKYSYKKSSSGYRYSKIGDCWAMSKYLYKKLTKKGTKARIVQYKTKMSSRHRSVQLYKKGKWVDYNYKAHGINKIYNATSSKPGLCVIASSKV
ncbi:MAG: hypothetical protein Q7U35_04310 [Methanobacteriaceae archaeon]|nr:hypothetical protein [Methanobacteriaceae archaeon]MDP2835712.1 hypothetical protein [Methanobacteriaceae archaeon]MDP3033745.1 hypothetical protein [Methanobacteriaceae archaeon]MDP3484029.1 hypothetical protein [Methanobacteriaceae archaeon]MDP3624541.1 hypothetical protein [Methanobacteriaceae archaeon]